MRATVCQEVAERATLRELKWAALIVAIVAAAALGAFAIYTFGHRPDRHSGHAEAMLDAAALAKVSGLLGQATSAREAAPDHWLVTYTKGGKRNCVLLDLGKFDLSGSATSWQSHGAGSIACSPPAPP